MALAGSAAVINSQGSATVGQHFMTGGVGVLWVPTARSVRITAVRGLGADGMRLHRLLMVERDDDNPRFQGPFVPGGLQAQVDHDAGRGQVELRPVLGSEVRCCGSSYQLYLDAVITGGAPGGSLLGVRLSYVTETGRRGHADVVMPMTYCTRPLGEPSCRPAEDRATAALARADR
ncbi:hypothetical protein KSP35_21890 [Aquihabitans sp. G128]|uniref:hypothetical protein n=1 Tax=Aquihabitans sp. G128 TaxID=2849779 RepID=UPI001C21E8DA|nr:hypothetical protein [Aquihabitans sp. G128]QXC60934.1 hypothetical protein KSP35_21890 [Aquihabitans sp. G128]